MMTPVVFSLLLVFSVSQIVLAGNYDDGVDAYNRTDYVMAIQKFRQAAETGDTKAQFNLGLMYEDGNGVPQDVEVAVRWYHQAAKAGYALAQVNLGLMYEEGRGVLQDVKAAVYWYRQAAEAGYVLAQYNLGVMYANGQGVPRDYVLAHKCFSLAATTLTDSEVRNLAIKNRDRVKNRMSPEQLAEAKRFSHDCISNH
ncbi:MAG: hypothetical protein CMH81_00110 [Nitrospiraceae bacterium]|jgi:hypothetical protein|nr:hypothetical protein [Nitrospiraceae bacterium]|tara:strand:- start:5199 stop:5792 length:594 start_codon:yes stop_codon:yes gene_type:complete